MVTGLVSLEDVLAVLHTMFLYQCLVSSGHRFSLSLEDVLAVLHTMSLYQGLVTTAAVT